MKFDLASSTESLGCGGVAVVEVLSKVVLRMIETSRQMGRGVDADILKKFQSSSIPGISVQDYLHRISSYAKCSDACFIIALIYIDRLIEMQSVVLTDFNIHRILMTSILLAAKVFEDEYFNNEFYARLGGVSTAELNSLELTFLKLIGFSGHVTLSIFNAYFDEFRKLDNPAIKNDLGLLQASLPPTPNTITRSLSSEDMTRCSSESDVFVNVNAVMPRPYAYMPFPSQGSVPEVPSMGYRANSFAVSQPPPVGSHVVAGHNQFIPFPMSVGYATAHGPTPLSCFQFSKNYAGNAFAGELFGREVVPSPSTVCSQMSPFERNRENDF